MPLRRLGIALIALIGVLHLILAPEYLEEEFYIGALFVAGALGCALVVWLLWRDAADRRAWALGALISAGMAVGFVASRTVGLPGFYEDEWELAGIVSVLAELGFVACAARAWRATDTNRPAFARR